MNESDNDKTIIKQRAEEDGDDKTRFAPARPVAEDKTRIALSSDAEKPVGQATDDKTRIAQRSQQAADDKTRIAQRTEQAADDKTRIAQRTEQAADDKTRIAQRPQQGTDNKNRIAAAKDDVTRFQPSVREATDDKTRREPAVNAQQEPQQQNTESEQHGMLKGRFVLESVLGAGGMGIVYKAKDLLKVEAQDRDPYVAIKVLSDEFKTHPEAFISLQRESRKSQRIAHPNIVNVHDFDKDGDTVFMTMEYMDGKPLDQLIRQYKSTGLPTDDAWSILKGMCSALIHAHREKIVHSDFKPGNVFVTHAGVAKVFDFGIARAVAKAEHLEGSPDDQTVFDAGNLGALTPAYASLEMLEGKHPDPRDDLYALGCVAYELFTGQHPYNKVHADEAYRQKLKPRRISGITKRQWRAIEKAIALQREHRTESVEQFASELVATDRPIFKIVFGSALIILLSAAFYFQYVRERPPGINESDIRDKVEYVVRLNFFRKTIENFVNDPRFSASWEKGLWTEISSVREMLGISDKWLTTEESDGHIKWLIATEKTVYKLYLDQIRTQIKAGKFERAQALINNASRYAGDDTLLAQARFYLAAEIEKEKQRVAKKLNLPGTAPRAPVAAPKKPVQKTAEFNVALDNVTEQLTCQSKLNMRNLDVAIKKLKSLNLSKYKRLEPNFIKALAACISRVGEGFPERAEDAKKDALRIFNNHRTLAAISIKARDPCDASIAGLGARGKRAICKDKVDGSNFGPSLVVIPGRGSLKTFAISKYEISNNELNMFCRKSSICSAKSGAEASAPATNMSINVVKAYLKWLSKKTNKKYRLPTKSEWVYAAKAKNSSADPNRNCELNTRGIQKGGKLERAGVGKQNSWGLVNHIGNAQEWVVAKGGTIQVIGGSYATPMDECTLDTVSGHTGKADPSTGFRVLRETTG